MASSGDHVAPSLPPKSVATSGRSHLCRVGQHFATSLRRCTYQSSYHIGAMFERPSQAAALSAIVVNVSCHPLTTTTPLLKTTPIGRTTGGIRCSAFGSHNRGSTKSIVRVTHSSNMPEEDGGNRNHGSLRAAMMMITLMMILMMIITMMMMTSMMMRGMMVIRMVMMMAMMATIMMMTMMRMMSIG